MAEIKSKYIGQIFDARWEYIGNSTFKNIYNGKTFTTSRSNASHVFTGRTTISNLLTYKCNGGCFSSRKRIQQIYKMKEKGRIA